MHASSMENMKRCVDWYLPDGPQEVIDLGSSDVNGSYRSLMPETARYVGFDLQPGPGVDRVMSDPYQIPLNDASVDVVLSGQMLEHCAHFWLVFSEISRVLRPGGLAFIIAPSAGPIHRYPVDCYRFYPDAYQALADWSGLRLVHCWMDERGPWRDLVGVFQKGGNLVMAQGGRKMPATAPINVVHGDQGEEITQGKRNYRDVLAHLHGLVQPQLYLEIGLRRGESLALASCDRIGIDPEPDLSPSYSTSGLEIFKMSSDDFFFFQAPVVLEKRKVNLGFIDGMHLFEFALRDFINLERFMSPGGAIVIDDVLPNRPVQAARERQSRVWCGDAWRLVPLLKKLRPDLRLTLLDTSPSGLLVVSNLNPASTVLSERYNPEVRAVLANPIPPPDEVLLRQTALAPSDENISLALGLPIR